MSLNDSLRIAYTAERLNPMDPQLENLIVELERIRDTPPKQTGRRRSAVPPGDFGLRRQAHPDAALARRGGTARAASRRAAQSGAQASSAMGSW